MQYNTDKWGIVEIPDSVLIEDAKVEAFKIYYDMIGMLKEEIEKNIDDDVYVKYYMNHIDTISVFYQMFIEALDKMKDEK